MLIFNALLGPLGIYNQIFEYYLFEITFLSQYFKHVLRKVSSNNFEI